MKKSKLVLKTKDRLVVSYKRMIIVHQLFCWVNSESFTKDQDLYLEKL